MLSCRNQPERRSTASWAPPPMAAPSDPYAAIDTIVIAAKSTRCRCRRRRTDLAEARGTASPASPTENSTKRPVLGGDQGAAQGVVQGQLEVGPRSGFDHRIRGGGLVAGVKGAHRWVPFSGRRSDLVVRAKKASSSRAGSISMSWLPGWLSSRTRRAGVGVGGVQQQAGSEPLPADDQGQRHHGGLVDTGRCDAHGPAGHPRLDLAAVPSATSRPSSRTTMRSATASASSR